MNDKKSKLLYIIGATIFTLIIITICLISILQKPYKKYENNIYLNYNVDIYYGENNFKVIRLNEASEKIKDLVVDTK